MISAVFKIVVTVVIVTLTSPAFAIGFQFLSIPDDAGGELVTGHWQIWANSARSGI
jgi:hypothetical protein